MSTANQSRSCSTTDSAASTAVRFHLSLNVGDLDRSIDFFRVFFGREPAKHYPDYAKFELNDPPLVLSLEPYQAQPGGNLNHLGFRMPDSQSLVAVQRRLELANISTRREEGVECCYARQTKFWVYDPDGNMWEVYTLDEDIQHHGAGQLSVMPESNDVDAPADSLWAHRLGEPFAQRLPILDGTVERVVLQGTFNQRLDPAESPRRLQEIFRILRPGGALHMHMLTANQPLNDEPLRLPGPAAPVTAVPVDRDMLTTLQQAGFMDARMVFHAATPCFRACGAELRETRIEAVRPHEA